MFPRNELNTLRRNAKDQVALAAKHEHYMRLIPIHPITLLDLLDHVEELEARIEELQKRIDRKETA